MDSCRINLPHALPLPSIGQAFTRNQFYRNLVGSSSDSNQRSKRMWFQFAIALLAKGLQQKGQEIRIVKKANMGFFRLVTDGH